MALSNKQTWPSPLAQIAVGYANFGSKYWKAWSRMVDEMWLKRC